MWVNHRQCSREVRSKGESGTYPYRCYEYTSLGYEIVFRSWSLLFCRNAFCISCISSRGLPGRNVWTVFALWSGLSEHRFYKRPLLYPPYLWFSLIFVQLCLVRFVQSTLLFVNFVFCYIIFVLGIWLTRIIFLPRVIRDKRGLRWVMSSL